MIAIRLENVVAIFEDFGSGNCDGFLADVQMKEAADLALGVIARRLFFESADHHHRSILPKQIIFVRQRNPHSGA